MADDLTFAQLYADLVEATAHNDPPPESFGVAQFAEDTGLSVNRALDVLKAMRARGQIEGDKFAINGSCQWRFWFGSG